MDNQFQVKILEDGKIEVTSAGGFSKSVHKSADEFLAYIHALAGGQHTKRKLPRTLAVSTQQQTQQQSL